MKPTDILSAEHRVIERVLECLDRMIHEADEAGRLAVQDARDTIDFLRNFADKCHHGKEEDNLFPAMEARGFSHDSGPIAVMLSEHEAGREHLRAMDDAIAAAAAGDPDALRRFGAHGRAYTDLLRQHIAKEDQVLFVMADRALSAEDQARLLARFERVEVEQMGPDTHSKYLTVAGRLAQRFGVPLPAAGACSCCCGH